MSTAPDFEARLDSLREEAKHGGPAPGRGVDVAGGPIPRQPGYYGEAVVKPPVWTWEISLYFFVGGAAGMAPLIACAALVLGLTNLARAALWITAAGAIISPILLVMDLGRPQLFFNMLRVFKHRSPMSVGAWILSIFGAFAIPAWLVFELYANEGFAPSVDPLVWRDPRNPRGSRARDSSRQIRYCSARAWIWLEFDKHGLFASAKCFAAPSQSFFA